MLSLPRIASAFLLCTLSSCAVAPSPSTTVRQQRQHAVAPRFVAPPSPEIVALRNQLIEEYRQLVAGIYSDYNGIRADQVGSVICVYHPLFTGYEFARGSLAPASRQWLNAHRDDLAKVGINTVAISASTGISIL
jgi:hypothetical protein